MPDRWQVTAVSDTTDRSGRIEAWEITLTRQFDDVAVSVWLPKMTIENTAVAYGLTSTDEALDVILHQMVLPIYEPDEVEPNPWYVSGKEARNAVLERVERCKRDYATVATAVQKQRRPPTCSLRCARCGSTR